jgi:YD repeat-containing protein
VRVSILALLLIAPLAQADTSATAPRAGTHACRELRDFKFPTHVGADGIPDEVITRTFDSAGRPLTERSHRDDAPDRQTSFAYDSSGRLTRETRGLTSGRTVSITTHRYDRAGREIEIAIDENVDGRPDWLTLKTYDSRGRLSTMRENVKAGTTRRGIGSWYHYDARDRLVLRKMDNDGDGTPNLEIAHAYDSRDRLVEKHSRWYEKGMSEEVFTYTYDSAGRVLTETDRYGFTWVHHYDSSGRLTDKVREVPPKLPDRTPMIRITYDYTCGGQAR